MAFTTKLFTSRLFSNTLLNRATVTTTFVNQFHSSVPQLSGTGNLSLHVDSKKNNELTPFDFTKENYQVINKIIAKYPKGYERAATIPLLHLAQDQNGGWLPLTAMHKIAKILGIQNMQVYEVASFYTMFNREPVGKYLVSVCTTTPCMIRDSDEVLNAIKSHLNIGMGETTPDGKFTLIEVECLGACVNAPMMQIWDDYYEDLTGETAVNVIKQLAAGKKPKVGVQSGKRKLTEPQAGKTTLLTPPTPPPTRADL